jgi:hypothetical protein
VSLKKKNPAIWTGDAGGFPVSIEENEHVMAFIREVNENQVIGIFNLSAKNQTVEITNEQVYGSYSDYFSGKVYDINKEPLELKPWEYLVFTK